ncbi:MAG: site-specific DNA-methyltransferase [Elusimicrobiales bacterium]|nr:site-specific DNA-methyltransferase [Elusimicrobiales bacterium]
MAEKAVNNGQNNEVPCGIRQRLDYNADFRLDWHDPDEATDGYQLKWIGKDYARLQSGTAPETVIIPDKKHNAELENKDSQNIFITGDNLQALKHLQNAYYGSVDMIYIDPPYNTGSDGFVYNDKFEFTDEQLQDNLGLTEEQIKRLKVINGRSSHSAWLTFMYPRLRIARTLLKDTGVIFISIDDNEQANLKLLCDEIFGERNFVSDFIRKTKSMTGDEGSGVNIQHENLLCYAKNKEKVFLVGEKKIFSGYSNPDNDPNGEWTSGDPSAKSGGESTYFPIRNPYTLRDDYPPRGRYWAFSKETLSEYIANGKIKFRKTYKETERGFIFKRYKKGLSSSFNPVNSLFATSADFMNSVGTTELFDIFNGNYFNNPKPVFFIQKIISTFNNESALIMDFFAGSATTAHAVMQLNKKDGKKHRYIMVQLDEPTKGEALKAGYTSIDQIARERIKRAAKQIGDSTGFKHFYVNSPNTAALNKITEFNPDNPNADKLFSEDIVQELGGTDVILQTWMAADGYMLTDIPQEIDIAGYKAYYCGNSVLYLIENGWQQANTKALLNLIGGNKINVNTIICCAYSFTFESMSELETNIRQSLSEISVEKRY